MNTKGDNETYTCKTYPDDQSILISLRDKRWNIYVFKSQLLFPLYLLLKRCRMELGQDKSRSEEKEGANEAKV